MLGSWLVFVALAAGATAGRLPPPGGSATRVATARELRQAIDSQKPFIHLVSDVSCAVDQFPGALLPQRRSVLLHLARLGTATRARTHSFASA